VAGKIDSVVPFRAFVSTVGDGRVTAPPHPLVKPPVVQSSYCLPRTAVIGSQSHCAVSHFLGLVVFRGRQKPVTSKRANPPSLRLGLSFRVFRG
jgi:hypothetical protein